MRKLASLYDNTDWNDNSDTEPGDEDFNNTIEMRKRFMVFKKHYNELKLLRVKAIIDENFTLPECVQELVTLLKNLICIDKLTVVSMCTSADIYTNVTGISPIDPVALRPDFKRLGEMVEVGKCVDVTKLANKFPTLSQLLKVTANTFCIKTKVEASGETTVTLYFYHVESASVKVLLENPSLFNKISELLFNYSDISLCHSANKIILNFEMFMDHITHYMTLVATNIETFMVPRLISNLEATTGKQVIWINDVVNISQYKQIEKGFFIGFHPNTKSPYLLNYAASEENIEVNFEVSAVWSMLRDWINKEKHTIKHYVLSDRISGNYILDFDSHYRLTYINCFDRKELGNFFVFPSKVNNWNDITLERVIKQPMMWTSIKDIIAMMLESGETTYEFGKPSILFTLKTNDNGSFKGITIVFKSSLMSTIKPGKNSMQEFEFAISPMFDFETEEVHDKAESVFSGRYSIFSALKNKEKFKGHLNVPSQPKLVSRFSGKKMSDEKSEASEMNSIAESAQKRKIFDRSKSKFYSTSRKSSALDLDVVKRIQEENLEKKKLIEATINNSVVVEFMSNQEEDVSEDAKPKSRNRHIGFIDPEYLRKLEESSKEDSYDILLKEKLEVKKQQYLQEIIHMKKKPNDEIVFGNPVNFDITKWNLNTLDLSEENHEALALVRDIYSKLGFFTEFRIDNDIFIGFLWQCHYFYTRFRNPFHNFFHAVTVTHAGAYFLNQIPRFSKMLDTYQKLAFITACLGHDLDHRGKNNPFEINSRSELAIRYFDKSPLENHHAATLFKILNNSETNIFSAIPADKLKDIKLNIIENILATDMKLHFPMLAAFKEKVAHEEVFCTPEDIMETTKMFTHCADLSGSCKEFAIASRWSVKVNEEFMEQYRQEQALKIPESAHFKNLGDPQGYLSSEIGFIDFILSPLYEVANAFSQGLLEEIMTNIKTTRGTYEKRLNELKAEAAKAQPSN